MSDDCWKSKKRVASGPLIMHPDQTLPEISPLPKLASEQVLKDANTVIHGQRATDYGSAEESFARIAQYWSIHLGVEVSGHDVAMMMVLMKVARAKTDHKHDTYVDIAGYAALAPRLNK